MELVKNEYKQSFLLYNAKQQLMPWSSHQPILVHTLNTITEGDVLEYGMGWNSTPIMHMICGMQGRKLLSVETHPGWFAKFESYKSENHDLLLIDPAELGRWDNGLFKRKYSVAFIDGTEKISRQAFMDALGNNVDYFVVHDTEEWAGKFRYPGYSYCWDFSRFKHQHHLQMGGPTSSLLSNLPEINEELLKIFE